MNTVHNSTGRRHASTRRRHAVAQAMMAAPLAGYRTYILAGLAVLAELAEWATADGTAAGLVARLPNILTALGLGTLRAGIPAAAAAAAAR